MPVFHLHADIEIKPHAREDIQRIVDKNAKTGARLERFPVPPKDHQCTGCPIDPHTMRYVLALMEAVRDHYLARGLNTDINDHVNGFMLFHTVDTIDSLIAAVCGSLAPELADTVMERFR